MLGQPLTAYIAGVKEGTTVHRWATGTITSTRDAAAEQRMRAAYQVIRQGRFKDALDAALTFVAYG